MCKKFKNIAFFLFEIINTSVLIPQNSKYIENLTIFQFGRIFLFLEGGGDGCLVKLVAAKVIRQHMFFFT